MYWLIFIACNATGCETTKEIYPTYEDCTIKIVQVYGKNAEKLEEGQGVMCVPTSVNRAET